MRIFEMFLDKFSETKLFEMSRSRKDAKDKITSLSPQIINHLIKLFVFHSPENKNHWINEIDNWLEQIDDIYLKPSNKKPDWQTVYNWFIYDSSPYYDSAYVKGKVERWIKNEYNNIQVYDYDGDVVLNQILGIIEKIFKDMEVPNKFISVREYLL